jgi:hypothetical protein
MLAADSSVAPVCPLSIEKLYNVSPPMVQPLEPSDK